METGGLLRKSRSYQGRKERPGTDPSLLPSGLQIVRQLIFVLSHPICGALVQQSGTHTSAVIIFFFLVILIFLVE